MPTVEKKARLFVPDASDTAYVTYVEEQMEALLGRQIEFEVQSRPVILAGFICEFDGQVYSNALASKLHQIRKSLMKREEDD